SYGATMLGMSSVITRRARIRGDRHQVTLPAEIREALHVRSGDEIEFSVDEHGGVTVRGYMSVPTDQAWFFTPSWQAGEREADEQIAAGKGHLYASDEGFLASFPAS
ncbi:MAG: AbrB/MazE/SpoVT family DNA-binding domain-containing protein, partial [Streptosporangiaceae bacterium]